MDILFLTDNFPPESNAPANRTFEHAREWVALGHHVTVITCVPNFPTGVVYQGYKNKWYQTEIMEGIKVVRVKTYMTANARFTRRIFDFLSFMVMGLIASLFQPKPDVVVATSPQFFCGVAGALSSILKRVPFVLEVRDLWPDAIVAVGVMPDRASIRCLKWVEGWMYRRASLIIIVSEAFRSTISARVKDPDKIKFVVNGVSTSFIKPDSIKPAPSTLANQIENSFVIGYIGTHGRSQRLGTVLQAAALLQHEKSIHFLMVGEGEKKAEIKKWVKEEGLTNVTLVPHQLRENIPGYIALCDIALVPLRDLPLLSKVIPSKIFEFMALGLPIIISVPKGAATNIVGQERCGLVTEPENPDQLKDAILKLQQDETLRYQLGSNGKKASGKYQREKLAQRMLSYIESTLENTSNVNSASKDLS